MRLINTTIFGRTVASAAAAAIGAILMAAPASAGTLAVTGTRTNITPPGSVDGSCGPDISLYFSPSLYAAGGTSNLGNYTYTAHHCIAAPPPGQTYDGTWEWTFDDGRGTVFGTDYSVLTPSGMPGVLNTVSYLTITGGSGRYLDASGWVTATGTVTFGQYQGQPATFGDFTLDGSVTAPGIPEPASWAFLIAGFALVGGAVRRRGVVQARLPS